MRKAKYLVAADLIARRVKRGDYAFKPIPSEERLSEETGVSRMTLRKAVVHLVKQGVVIRRPNGRIGVPRKKSASRSPCWPRPTGRLTWSCGGSPSSGRLSCSERMSARWIMCTLMTP